MPERTKSICGYPGCFTVTISGRCEKHRKTHNWQPDQVRGNTTQRGYGWRWQKLRALPLRRDSGLCVECRAARIIKAAIQVDHIEPKSRGGRDELENLQSLCDDHHRKKTATEGGGGRKKLQPPRS